MKIVKPKLSKYMEELVLYEESTYEDLVDIVITDQDIDFKIEGIEFNGCKFVNVDFSSFPLKRVDLIDCVFERCNLSGCDFSDRAIHRVCFDRCNLVGCDFIGSSLSDISIIDSKCNYINFSDSTIKNLLIKDSILKEGRIVNTKLCNIEFDNVDFSMVEFLNTKLGGLDFSNCNINDIGVSVNDIRGVTVNSEQALMLISLLGIVVK